METREPWTVELLYGDHEGGQRAVTRFTRLPLSMHPDAAPPGGSPEAADEEAATGWFASQSRHWNID